MGGLKHVVGRGARKRFISNCSFTALAVFLLLCAAVTFGQSETAALVGTVVDSSGAIVPGAAVTITNLGTNIVRSATTSADGNYVFDLLQVGAYSVTVMAQGFKTYSTSNLTLSAGDRARVDVKMEVGSVAQTVEVSAAIAPALETDSSDISSLVTSQAVEDVPLNGRDIFKLIQLSPGVTVGAQNDLSSGNRPNDRRLTSDITVNGQMTNANNNMIDGLDNNQRLQGNVQIRPSVDAVQEVDVMLNKYDASVGRTAGAVVNVITKSGTNAFHGSAYEFFRNDVLNTNPNYQFPSSYNASTGVLNLTAFVPKPAFRQNQYGGSLGGPIKKNKAFFFVDYEGFANALGIPLTSTVPTTCMRGTAMVAMQAAAEGISVPAVDCSQGNNTALAAPGNFSELTPISLPGGSSGTGAAKTGAVIPLASQTAFADALFSLYPLPNAPGLTNNYTDNPLRIQNAKTLDFKIDQHFSERNTLSGRYSFNSVWTLYPPNFGNVNVKKVDPYWTGGDLDVIPGPSNSGIPTIATQSINNFALTYVHVFRPTLLLDLKAAYLRNNVASVPFNYGNNVTTGLGQNCDATNCVNYGPITASGLTDVTITGFTGLGDVSSNPEYFIDDDFQQTASLTWNKGAHSLRFGVGLIYRQDWMAFPPNVIGTFTFTGIYTGVAPGDFLEGLGTTGSRQNPVASFQGFRTWEPSGYVQDDWRATHWLTLNIGVRYDIFSPLVEKRGRVSNWDPASGLLMSPSPLFPGAQQTGPTALIPTTYRNIAPRFGFAATLPHQTVLRGGFGFTTYPQIGAYNNFTGAGGVSAIDMLNAPFNFIFSCTTQNNQQANTACAGPLNNGALAKYGPSGSTSSVGQSGGISLQNGLPVPFLNLSSAIPPAGCTFDTNADYSTPGKGSNGLIDPATCPNNPYNNGIPIAVWPGYIDPVVSQFNVQVQKQFGANVITVGYVGELGRHSAVQYKPNNVSNSGQNGVLPLATEYPWLAKSAITSSDAPWGTSSYNSLQATFVRRFAGGLTVSANYSWVHQLTNSNAVCQPTVSNSVLGYGSLPAYTNPCFYDNPASPGTTVTVNQILGGPYGVGNTGLDVPNRIAWTANYQLPFGKSLTGVAGALVKGWSTNGAFAWQTGGPFTLTTTVQPPALPLGCAGAACTTPAATVGSGRPNQICSGDNASKSLANWGVNPACFTLAATNTWGTEHANQFFGPNLSVMDFSLIKDFVLTEKIRAQFRTEVFNLFNTPGFSPPSVTAIPSFGTATNVPEAAADLQNPKSPTSLKVGAITALNNNYNSRQIQFALKFLF